MITYLAQAAGEPMSWWQALITVLAIFAFSTVIVLLIFRGRR